MSNDLVFVEKLPTVMDVKESEEGPYVVIDGEEVPVIDSVATITVVQPGHLTIKDNKAKYANHKGKFYNELLEESSSELRLLPLAVLRHGRRLYAPYDPNNTELLCYSLDGENPASKVEQPICDKCGTFTVSPRGEYFVPNCPKSVWAGDKKPECSESLMVAFFDIDKKIPVEMQLTGTQISAWNAFKKSYKQKKNAARIKRKSINDFIIKALVEDEGTYVSVSFALENAEQENPGKYGPLMKLYWDNLFIPLQKKRDEELANQNAVAVTNAADYDVNMEKAPEVSEAEASGQDFNL